MLFSFAIFVDFVNNGAKLRLYFENDKEMGRFFRYLPLFFTFYKDFSKKDRDFDFRKASLSEMT